MKIVVIGTGNVAYHLVKVLINKGLDVVMVYAHTEAGAREFSKVFNVPVTTDLGKNAEADLYVIAVKDSAIAQVASRFRGRPLVHTAGAVEIDVLSFYTDIYGVFYPFQTFRKEYDINWAEVPIFIEACCGEFEELLRDLGKRLSGHVNLLSSSKRKYLHLSGVLVNNFVNHLLYQTKVLLENKGLKFEWTFPLLKKTIENIQSFEPYVIQTGPARRGDMASLQAHLELIKDLPELERIYRAISDSIINLYRDDKAR